MGTTCEIARIRDGRVDRVHVSYDGYLGGVGLNLFRFYDTEEKVDALFSHRTGATSLEANPNDMSWNDWDEENYRNQSLGDYVEEQRLSIQSYATRPSDPQNGERLVRAIAEADPSLIPNLSPSVQTRGYCQPPVNEISVATDIRQLPEATRALVPGIVDRLFGINEPYAWEHAYGSLQMIADHHATPADFDFDDAWVEDEGTLDYVWAHGKWCLPRGVRDLKEFIETGDSERVITRELLMSEEGNCSEADFANDREPPRPFNEHIGILEVDAEEMATLVEDNGERWSVSPADNLVIEHEPEHYIGKRVRVLFGTMMSQFSTDGSGGNFAEIIKLELADAE